MKRAMFACLVIAMVAAACSSDSQEPPDSPESTTTTGSGDAAATSTTEGGSAAEEPTTTTVGAVTTTTVAAAAGLDGCVVGTWEMDSNRFFEDVIAFGPQDGVEGEFVHVGGAYLLIIGGDGAFEVRRDNWAFAVTSDFGDLEVVINASQSGTYELDGDMLSTRVEPGEPPEIVIKVDGEPFEFPGGISPIAPPEAEFSGATVTCDGDTLTASAEGFSSIWGRSG